jgi:hypothetical protein
VDVFAPAVGNGEACGAMSDGQLPADGGLPIDVHGVVDATLAPLDGGPNVTFHAAF